MNRTAQLLLSGLASACFVMACSSYDVIATATDAPDGSTAPPTDDVRDAGDVDASRPPVGLSDRLEVECTADPCYVALSGSGGGHVCGLVSDGTVRCWGRDTFVQPSAGGVATADGALGRGRTVSRVEAATPAPVVGLTDVKQISVGRGLGTCALTNDGSVYCWGNNSYGQLGHPLSDAQVSSPKRVEGLPPASAVALGGAVGCAIAAEDGALWCWGTRNLRSTWVTPYAVGPVVTHGPERLSEFGGPVREIAVGSTSRSFSLEGEPYYNDTIMALREDGVLVSHGSDPAADTAALPWLPSPSPVAGVARLGTYAYLGTDGLVKQWFPERSALIAAGISKVVDVIIAPHPETSLTLLQAGLLLGDGRLYRWGYNAGGELGYPIEQLAFAPAPLPMTHVIGSNVVSFAMTRSSTCASLSDGQVKCWGSNGYGELGRGTIDDDRHPEAEQIR